MARGSTSTARPSDHFSRTQAMVVLKNSSDSMRFVFRKHANDDALRDYETIPLNGTRRSTMMDDDDIVSLHPATASSASSCGSVHLMVKSSTIRNSYSAEYLHNEASSSVPCFQGSPCFFDNTASADTEHFCYVLHNKMAAEAINKAQKPRNCNACDVNGHVSMTTEPAVCVYDSIKSSIVR